MDIILVAGLWLRQSIWADVAAELERVGHRPISVHLPGPDAAATNATLQDQVDAVIAAVDSADRPLLVGHSAACTLVWMAADQRPTAINAVMLIGGFPSSDGEPYADFFETVDGVMAFPGWGPFEGPDSADLDAVARDQIASNAVPVPEGVSKGIVRLSDDRRFDLPVAAICPEYTPDQARAWIDAGDVPELAKAKRLTFVDIDSGHWPMVSQPRELARLIAEAAS
jgi:pimeloyl-ACP methyl ester carboxylesterase